MFAPWEKFETGATTRTHWYERGFFPATDPGPQVFKFAHIHMHLCEKSLSQEPLGSYLNGLCTGSAVVAFEHTLLHVILSSVLSRGRLAHETGFDDCGGLYLKRSTIDYYQLSIGPQAAHNCPYKLRTNLGESEKTPVFSAWTQW